MGYRTRVRSQAEIDYYGALDAGEDPKITQAHLAVDMVKQGREKFLVNK